MECSVGPMPTAQILVGQIPLKAEVTIPGFSTHARNQASARLVSTRSSDKAGCKVEVYFTLCKVAA